MEFNPTGRSPYNGPERRTRRSSREQMFAAMLDEIDYGALLMLDETTVGHVNHVAHAELGADHPIVLEGSQLRARDPRDAEPLHQAVAAARQRGVRKMLLLGKQGRQGAEGGVPVNVVVVPLLEPDSDVPVAALLMFAKRRICESLSVSAFARCYGLTPCETQVLQALCDGLSTRATAVKQNVEMATLRAQIGSIRAKTGADSIVALICKVAMLPPLIGALRHNGRGPGRPH